MCANVRGVRMMLVACCWGSRGRWSWRSKRIIINRCQDRSVVVGDRTSCFIRKSLHNSSSNPQTTPSSTAPARNPTALRNTARVSCTTNLAPRPVRVSSVATLMMKTITVINAIARLYKLNKTGTTGGSSITKITTIRTRLTSISNGMTHGFSSRKWTRTWNLSQLTFKCSWPIDD